MSYAGLAPGLSSPDPSSAIVAVRSVSVVRPGSASGSFAAFFAAKNPERLVKFSRDGSGVVIDPKGVIVTNAHIVQGATAIFVRFSDGTRMEGRLLSIFPEQDLAFLFVHVHGRLPFMFLADSDELTPGERVFCIGGTLDHDGAVLHGKVQARLRPYGVKNLRTELLQIVFGFHLYGGDSGSPVVDGQGRMVGLVSAGRRDGDLSTLAITSNVIRDAFGRTGLWGGS